MWLKGFALFSGPLLFALTIFFGNNYFTPEISGVLCLAIWMIIWWVTEIVPIPVTALLPMIILPFIGVFDISESTAPYANPIIFLFMGGFMIALGLEKHKLHLRIALNILKWTGTSGNGIILGFMISTALLSMWISNTATTVMMLPVAISVIEIISLDNEDIISNNRSFPLALMLCIAYSANIGGTMTLIGTPPNVVMAGYANELLNLELNFSTWMVLGLSTGIPMLALTFIVLTRILFPNNIKRIEGSERRIEDQLQNLGALSKAEKRVIAIFTITALAWIFKSQINSLFDFKILTDSITAMAGGILMFITPVNFKEKRFILDWTDTEKLPWGILILFGGGMCLARALEEVGLIQMISGIFESYNFTYLLLLIFLITIIVLFLTEVMSNVALVTIFIPVAVGIAAGLDVKALYIIIPATLASSCAFMMPISTPPNAVVFSSGHVKMKEMIKAGWVLNILASIIISGICYGLIAILFY